MGAYQAFIQRDAQRIQIGLRGDFAAAHLLWCGIRRGARCAVRRGDRCGRKGGFGNAEIAQIGISILVEQDVIRLDVPMDNAVLMGERERAANLVDDAHCAVKRKRSGMNERSQTAAAQPAHDKIGGAVILAPVVEQWDDVQVIELGNDAGFGFETLDEFRFVGTFGQDDLDGDFAVQSSLIRPVDCPKSTGSDALAQLVSTYCLPAQVLHVVTGSRCISRRKVHFPLISSIGEWEADCNHPARDRHAANQYAYLGLMRDLGDTVEQDAADVVIVGAGAAGLMAGLIAARTAPHRRVVLLEGARKLGAKILVSGGGRCNVTHDIVDEHAYAGSSQNAIKKVIRRFDVAQTVECFRNLGVTLKREATGKLFPTSDDAHTVLEGLLRGLRDSGAIIRNPYRVEQIVKEGDAFRLSGVWGSMDARIVILATGGKSLPKSGSDGGGYALAQSLGHRLTARIFPALVPLTLPRDHWIPQHSGITHTVTLTVRSGEGKALIAFTNSMLCTHFGISGPAALDISRYWTAVRLDDPAAHLTVNWMPDSTPELIDSKLQRLGKTTLLRFVSDPIPERLARAIISAAGLDPAQTGDTLTREARRTLTRTLTALVLPVTGDRGFTHAEVTAGGIPLSEIRVETMESRITPGLYLCGELCDVDGRIGGYNFQWAWSSGYVAGLSAARAVE